MAPAKRRAPGTVRDAIIKFLASHGEAQVSEIISGVEAQLGKVTPSSVRSYLNLDKTKRFDRVGRGRYRLKRGGGGG